MSQLPREFRFSQANLQDYTECDYRFYLRYLERLTWPAVEAEPILEKEDHMRRGADFHRLIERHLRGLPTAKQAAADPELALWWDNFLATGLNDLPEERYPEKLLSTQLEGRVLLAKCDLIAVQRGERFVIVDWKTNRQHPPRHRLQNRLQTRVYRYVLARAGAPLNNGQPIPPERIELRYWFANFPDDPLSFPYDAAQFAADERDLGELIRRIEAQAAEDFHKTSDERRCRFCMYRSLCGRGAHAGHYAEAEDGFLLDDAISDADSLGDSGDILPLEF